MTIIFLFAAVMDWLFVGTWTCTFWVRTFERGASFGGSHSGMGLRSGASTVIQKRRPRRWRITGQVAGESKGDKIAG